MSVRSGLRLSLVCFFLFALAQIGLAQTKVAIINLQQAVLTTAEIKKASADLEAKYKPRQQAIEKLQNELQSIQQQLQANAGKLTPSAQSDLTAEYQQKQRDAQRMTEDLQQDVNQDRNDILAKSTKKMQAIVKQLADAKGFDIVIDAQAAVYFKTAVDITQDAIAAYDKAYPVTVK